MSQYEMAQYGHFLFEVGSQEHNLYAKKNEFGKPSALCLGLIYYGWKMQAPNGQWFHTAISITPGFIFKRINEN